MKFLNQIDGADKLVQYDDYNLASTAEKTTWNNKSEIPFVIGTQTATTASWTGVADTIDALYNGLTIRYWLPRTSATNVTLNLTLKGGSTTGAINCYYGGTTRLTTHYPAGSVIMLTYVVSQLINGTAYTGWWAHADYDSNTNTYDRTLWGNTITAGAPIYDYKLLMQGLDGKFYPLTLEEGTGTTKTISTQEFEINTQILFYDGTTNVALNGTLTSVYSEVPITTLNYTANQASWTSQKLIYLKGTILANGNFKLDNTTYTSFMTQTLPTTADGFVYVLLGYMYSTTGMRLFQFHPMYEFRDGHLRVYMPVHTHGSISDDGKIGSEAGKIIETGTNGVLQAKVSGTTSQYLRGDGTWATPPDTVYTHPTSSGNKHIPSGGASNQILRYSADGTAVWSNENNTTYDVATTSTNGLMSSTDKTKLDGVEAGANKYVHPTGTNPHGTTKADVGLGNVTNESKATMFTSPTFTGTPTSTTPIASDNSTKIATTEFVNLAITAAISSSTVIDGGTF